MSSRGLDVRHAIYAVNVFARRLFFTERPLTLEPVTFHQPPDLCRLTCHGLFEQDVVAEVSHGHSGLGVHLGVTPEKAMR